MPPCCSTCGTAIGASAAEAFCNEKCSASYKRALERHPRRHGQHVCVPATAHVLSVCSRLPALVHERCTNVEQVRIGVSGHYLLPSAVVDPITAWVEHIGVNITKFEWETPQSFAERQARGITNAQYFDLLRQEEERAAAAAALQERRREASEAIHKRRLREADEVTEESERKRRVAAVEEEEEAERKRRVAATQREAEASRMRLGPISPLPPDWLALPEPVLLNIIMRTSSGQQRRALYRASARLARLIDANGLLLPWATPAELVVATVRACFAQDLHLYSACERQIADTLAPLLYAVVDALHAACCVDGVSNYRHSALVARVAELAREREGHTALVAAEAQRIMTHSRYARDAPLEVVLLIALGLDVPYITEAEANNPRFTHAELDRLSDRGLQISAMAEACVVRRLCLETLRWLYTRTTTNAGPQLYLQTTCMFTLDHVLERRSGLMQASVYSNDLRYFVPREVGGFVQLWLDAAPRHAWALEDRGFYLLHLGSPPCVVPELTPCSDQIVEALCRGGYLQPLCKTVLLQMHSKLAPIWIESVMQWVRSQINAVALLLELSALSPYAETNTLTVAQATLFAAFLAGVHLELQTAFKRGVAAEASVTGAELVAAGAMRSLTTLLHILYTAAFEQITFGNEVTRSQLLGATVRAVCTADTPRIACRVAAGKLLVFLRSVRSPYATDKGTRFPMLLDTVPYADLARLALRDVLRDAVHSDMDALAQNLWMNPVYFQQLLDAYQIAELNRDSTNSLAYRAFDSAVLLREPTLGTGQTEAMRQFSLLNKDSIRTYATFMRPGIWGVPAPGPITPERTPEERVIRDVRIYTLAHGCEAFATLVYGAIDRTYALTDRATGDSPYHHKLFSNFMDLTAGARTCIAPLLNQPEVELELFQYGLVLFAKRMLALDYRLIVTFGAAPSASATLFGAVAKPIADSYVRAGTDKTEFGSMWFELANRAMLLHASVGPLQKAYQAAATNKRLRRRDQTKFMQERDSAYFVLRNAVVRAQASFFDITFNVLGNALTTLPRPDYFTARAVFATQSRVAQAEAAGDVERQQPLATRTAAAERERELRQHEEAARALVEAAQKAEYERSRLLQQQTTPGAWAASGQEAAASQAAADVYLPPAPEEYAAGAQPIVWRTPAELELLERRRRERAEMDEVLGRAPGARAGFYLPGEAPPSSLSVPSTITPASAAAAAAAAPPSLSSAAAGVVEDVE